MVLINVKNLLETVFLVITNVYFKIAQTNLSVLQPCLDFIYLACSKRAVKHIQSIKLYILEWIIEFVYIRVLLYDIWPNCQNKANWGKVLIINIFSVDYYTSCFIRHKGSEQNKYKISTRQIVMKY